MRRAIAEHAVAVVTDGTGVDATWKLAEQAHVPIGIVYDGDRQLVDPHARPNVFRIAPTNHGMAFRLAEYLIPKRPKLAFLTDDTGYGRAGRAALDQAFSGNRRSVVARIQTPSSSTDLAPQVLQARNAGATALVVWGQPASIAEAVVAARSSGWQAPVYAPPAAEDPLVRQELANQPRWLDGLTFTTGRLTAEEGVAPFYAFEQNYVHMFGVEKVGVKTRAGQAVVQPPEFAMYGFDFANLLATAVDHARSTDGARVIAALNQVSTRGANGDSRGFNVNSHEGVVDDDMYFARFEDMTFRPVSDDPLSRTLPVLDQFP
ncbi:MAG: amino acid transporter substrate-binding protein [Solirubrobacteraceae bacterium]|nr:amino acid transporter substrate-binding protein [Solirubrobacteraceae bacterium]